MYLLLMFLGIPCFPPPDVPHGKHSGRSMNDFSYGTAVSYTCDKGHPLVGNATIYCTTKDGLNGIWSGRAYCGGVVFQCYSLFFYCLYGKVQFVLIPKHDDLAMWQAFSSDNKGTDALSEGLFFYFVLCSCMFIKHIFFSVAHCPAPQIENGRIVTGYSVTYTYNQRVTLDCNAGHKIVGSREIHCQVDGTWDPPLPHCEQGKYHFEALSYETPHPQTDFPFRLLLTEAAVFTNGMSVKYTCEPGYGLIGEGTIYCTASGTWSSPAPRCEGTSFDHKIVHIGSSRANTYTYNQRVTLDCNAGYKISGTREIHCQVDGTWDPPLPHCELGNALMVFPAWQGVGLNGPCGLFQLYDSMTSHACTEVATHPVVQDGMKKISEFKDSYTFGGNITFECKIGYFMIGSYFIRCEANNTWIPKVPSCKKGKNSLNRKTLAFMFLLFSLTSPTDNLNI
uniref:Sushi domain-containing protein n=1 Tax=Podarcis muralis TaxID=64176 RepID=A0A670I9Q6_PODMU